MPFQGEHNVTTQTKEAPKADTLNALCLSSSLDPTPKLPVEGPTNPNLEFQLLHS